MSVDEVAELLGVTVHRVRQLTTLDVDPLPRLGLTWRFHRPAVEDWLARNGPPAPAPARRRTRAPVPARRCVERPFALADLERLLDATSAAEVADVLGLAQRTVVRFRSIGLSELQADRVACTAGYHPTNVWPHWPTGPTQED